MTRIKIKEIANAKGILQSRLQIIAAVTPPLLNRYWNNKTTTVDLRELEKIAKALGVSPGDLLEPDEERLEKENSIPDETVIMTSKENLPF